MLCPGFGGQVAASFASVYAALIGGTARQASKSDTKLHKVHAKFHRAGFYGRDAPGRSRWEAPCAKCGSASSSWNFVPDLLTTLASLACLPWLAFHDRQAASPAGARHHGHGHARRVARSRHLAGRAPALETRPSRADRPRRGGPCRATATEPNRSPRCRSPARCVTTSPPRTAPRCQGYAGRHGTGDPIDRAAGAQGRRHHPGGSWLGAGTTSTRRASRCRVARSPWKATSGPATRQVCSAQPTVPRRGSSTPWIRPRSARLSDCTTLRRSSWWLWDRHRRNASLIRPGILATPAEQPSLLCDHLVWPCRRARGDLCALGKEGADQ